jgi:hypothetical protein
MGAHEQRRVHGDVEGQGHATGGNDYIISQYVQYTACSTQELLPAAAVASKRMCLLCSVASYVYFAIRDVVRGNLSKGRKYAATAACALLMALSSVVLLAVCRLAGLDWEQLSLDTLFVDPPRAGLDPATEQMLQDFQQVRRPFTLLQRIS